MLAELLATSHVECESASGSLSDYRARKFSLEPSVGLDPLFYVPDDPALELGTVLPSSSVVSRERTADVGLCIDLECA